MEKLKSGFNSMVSKEDVTDRIRFLEVKINALLDNKAGREDTENLLRKLQVTLETCEEDIKENRFSINKNYHKLQDHTNQLQNKVNRHEFRPIVELTSKLQTRD